MPLPQGLTAYSRAGARKPRFCTCCPQLRYLRSPAATSRDRAPLVGARVRQHCNPELYMPWPISLSQEGPPCTKAASQRLARCRGALGGRASRERCAACSARRGGRPIDLRHLAYVRRGPRAMRGRPCLIAVGAKSVRQQVSARPWRTVCHASGMHYGILLTSRHNLSPFTKGCRKWGGSTLLLQLLGGAFPNSASWIMIRRRQA